MKDTEMLKLDAQDYARAAAIAIGKYAHQLNVSADEKAFRDDAEVAYANAIHRIALNALKVSRELAQFTEGLNDYPANIN